MSVGKTKLLQKEKVYMRLFSKLFGNKEEKEFLACAKVLCMVAAADKKIIEKEN